MPKNKDCLNMKLIKGSYCYLVGIFLLSLASVFSLVSFIFAVINHSAVPASNPYLSAFGSRVSSSLTALICSAFFAVCAIYCSWLILINGLKTNSLAKPMCVLSGLLWLYAGLIFLVTLLNTVWSESFLIILLRFSRVVPPILLSFFLTQMLHNGSKFKIPALLAGVANAIQTFLGFGFQNIFLAHLEEVPDFAIRGWLSLFFFALALSVFFSGICFCIGGCEKRIKNRKSEGAGGPAEYHPEQSNGSNL